MRLHREQERELLGAGGKREFYPGSVQLCLEPDALSVGAGVSSGAEQRAGLRARPGPWGWGGAGASGEHPAAEKFER